VKLVRRAILAMAAVLGIAGAAAAADALPQLDRARSGPCVQDPKVMRKSHMDFLQHDRDATVRRGIRDRKESLAGCVDCHASRTDGRVIGTERHFCQGCHTYAAVKLDCFECHASRAREPAARTAAAKGAS
jgi:[DsrC]-trisulfide reductase subunit J